MNGLRLPDFIIAGAPRSGTTWLWHLLDRHPLAYMAKPAAPEPKFFLIDDLHRRGLSYYSERWFKDAPEGRLLGEKSTNYLENGAVAARIKAALPGVKLLFILRDPITRAFSNFLWSQKNGLEKETDFEKALELEESRTDALPDRLRYARPFSYYSRGLYADMLAPFLAAFPRDQILCLRYEDIAADPGQVGAATCNFLSLPPTGFDAASLGVINETFQVRTADIPKTVRSSLAKRYAAPNERLKSLIGPDFKGWRY